MGKICSCLFFLCALASSRWNVHREKAKKAGEHQHTLHGRENTKEKEIVVHAQVAQEKDARRIAETNTRISGKEGAIASHPRNAFA
jgi:hypothetical protein